MGSNSYRKDLLPRSKFCPLKVEPVLKENFFVQVTAQYTSSQKLFPDCKSGGITCWYNENLQEQHTFLTVEDHLVRIIGFTDGWMTSDLCPF